MTEKTITVVIGYRWKGKPKVERIIISANFTGESDCLALLVVFVFYSV